MLLFFNSFLLMILIINYLGFLRVFYFVLFYDDLYLFIFFEVALVTQGLIHV